MNPHDVVDVELTDSERRLLRSGLLEWGGPAKCTHEMAVALGFKSVDDIFVEGDRLRDVLAKKLPLTRLDWLRTLLATEVVFASEVLGAGSDWPITTGMSDEVSIRILRSVQRKLLQVGVRQLIGNGFGTRMGTI